MLDMPTSFRLNALDASTDYLMNGTKREIIGSIYPENLTFDGEHYRTARLNEAVRQIYLIEKELQENKNGTSEENFDLCRKAERGGLAPLIP